MSQKYINFHSKFNLGALYMIRLITKTWNACHNKFLECQKLQLFCFSHIQIEASIIVYNGLLCFFLRIAFDYIYQNAETI